MKKIRIMIVFLLGVFVIAGCDFKSYNQTQTRENYCVDTIVETQSEETSDEPVSEVYKRVVKTTVTVITYDSQYNAISSGSGVVFGEDSTHAFIYTNGHVVSYTTTSIGGGVVVNDGKYFEVIFHNNYRVAASLVVRDGSEDVAVLKVLKNNNYEVATFGNSSTLNIGQQVMAIGSPLGFDYSNTLTVGVISGLNISVATDNDEDGNETTMYLTQIDASLNPGNSGGPLFDMNGNLIGINTLKIVKSNTNSSVDDFNFSIPINHFKLVADTLLEEGSYKRPLIGVSVIDITEMDLEHRSELGISVSYGLYVDSVLSTGASYGVVSPNTIVTKINGVCITRRNQLSLELYKHLPGDTITLEVADLDGYNAETVQIILG